MNDKEYRRFVAETVDMVSELEYRIQENENMIGELFSLVEELEKKVKKLEEVK